MVASYRAPLISAIGVYVNYVVPLLSLIDATRVTTLFICVIADPETGGKKATIQLRGGKPAGGCGARSGTARHSASGTGEHREALTVT